MTGVQTCALPILATVGFAPVTTALAATYDIAINYPYACVATATTSHLESVEFHMQPT